MIDPAQLEELRTGYRSRSDYLRFVSDIAKDVLDEIMADPRFPGATDPVTLFLIGTLLRAIEPGRVLQLGTHIGFSTLFIGDVLGGNTQPGMLVTVDPDPLAHELARPWVGKAGLADTVSFIDGHSTDSEVNDVLRSIGPFDVIYLDSSHAYETTIAELDLIFERGPWLGANGLLILHDAAASAAQFDRTGEGGVRRALDEWFAPRAAKYQLFILEKPLWPSVCGVALMRRRDPAVVTNA